MKSITFNKQTKKAGILCMGTGVCRVCKVLYKYTMYNKNTYRREGMFEDKNWDAIFKKRLARHYDEMKWLYSELYHNDQQAFNYFCEMMYDYYEKRSPLLKEWDEAREASPDWYKGNDMLGMLMYTNCFAGNLKGVKKHLDYIQECGVNYLHLMPLLESPKDRSDGGYAVSDFRKVQPELGTMDDLAALADDCHTRGMCVCLDFVMNHTSEDHEWAKRAKAGEKEYQDRFFFYDDWTIPNEFEKTVPQVFPQTAPGNFSWCEEAGKVVMTTFWPYQWDLNYANPVVFNDMTADMLNLCNHGVDIIRLDATPYIWKEIGTPCRNLPQVHTLVRLMHMASEVVCPGTLLLGEVVMEPSKVVPYFGTIDKPECHMLYNVTTMASTWHTVATHDVRLLRHQMEAVFALPHQYTFLNYLRCHDDIGWGLDYEYLKQFGISEVPHKKYLNDYLRGLAFGSDARGELYNDDPRLGDARLCGTTASLCGIEAAEYEKNSWKLDRGIGLDIMLHAFLLTQSGIPVLYAGDEIGQLNDYTYHEDPIKAEDSRYLHRGDMNWDNAALRNVEGTRENRIFKALRQLEEIRAEYSVFESEADTWIIEPWNDHILAIGRYYNGEKLLAFFNFSENEQTAWVNEYEDYYDLLTGERKAAKAITMPGYSFLWLMTTFNKPFVKKQHPKLDRKPVENIVIEEVEPAKKPAAKKTTTKKAAAKKPAAKKAAEAKEPAAKKTAAKKTAAKKTTAKKAAAKKAVEVKETPVEAPAAAAPVEAPAPAAPAETPKAE